MYEYVSYLHVEGEVASFCLFQVTLGVFQSHLQAVGLRLDLTQLCLLPLGFHLFLCRQTWYENSHLTATTITL